MVSVFSWSGGGFASFCAYPGANLTGQWLGVFCQNDNSAIFGYNYSWLNLDLCVGNNAGQLANFEYGNYSASCRDCSIVSSHSLYLVCSCTNMQGQLQNSSVDLNTTLFVSDGAASCFNYFGNKSWTGPDPKGPSPW
ncbi:hypothetical protein B0H67DRAFT_476245 [Lasiosphaeris hirsuta]|uniref:Cyanovirin-N domain-containing protein n=1 Tax=Lasiosphaeris hirsuta TaxID=260670 RepID=A0AA40BA80_9PEZI|nr:hypothetical protein B0H67DRAFT_476245 [Lasiosphaeris hirsuta]